MTKLQILQNIATAVVEVKNELSTEKGMKVMLKPPKEEELTEGFSVYFSDKKMIVQYHAHIRLADVDSKKFEGEIDENISFFVSKVKKKFKEMTGSNLNLNKVGDYEKEIFTMTMKRSWVVAKSVFEIKNKETDSDGDED